MRDGAEYTRGLAGAQRLCLLDSRRNGHSQSPRFSEPLLEIGSGHFLRSPAELLRRKPALSRVPLRHWTDDGQPFSLCDSTQILVGANEVIESALAV